ncbi:MAG: GNAT family N-acetyltransferase [Acidimicrobiales bacterium]
MPPVEVRPADGILSKRRFVDVPFRLHGDDPNWAPPLRLSVYDRLSRRHPASAHQRWALWTAHQDGKVVGRIAACTDSLFNEHWGEQWAWVGFFDSVNDPDVAASLFDVALDWSRRQGAKSAVGPANFTTNDELGLLVDGFGTPAMLLTLENPPYYEDLWVRSGWDQVMDLYGYEFRRGTVSLSDRQRQTLQRLRQRSKVVVRDMRTDDYDAEVGRFFDLYNQIWQRNWGYVPMPEPEVRHLAKQLKQLMNPHWVFALERAGEPVAVCLCLPDANALMQKIRSGRLLPFGWARLMFGLKRLKRARIVALGIRPDVENLALGPLLYNEITDRLMADGVEVAEASWTLATNRRINKQLEDMGGRRYKVWRMYKRDL